MIILFNMLILLHALSIAITLSAFFTALPSILVQEEFDNSSKKQTYMALGLLFLMCLTPVVSTFMAYDVICENH